MKLSFLLWASFLVFLTLFFCSYTSRREEPFTAPGQPAPAGEISLKNMDREILVYVNLHRKSIGLKPLLMSNIESRIAAKHSYNMATGKVPFGHKDLKKRMDLIASQVGYISATGENVASGQMDAREVVDGWLHSPGHRRNIEGDFTLTGIGIAKDAKGLIYYTQIFTR
jgi:uncharacterized protein YkwD